MHQLTEVYRAGFDDDGKRFLDERPVLVNLARVVFIRDYGTSRRIYFGNSADSDYIDVAESLVVLQAIDDPIGAVLESLS